MPGRRRIAIGAAGVLVLLVGLVLAGVVVLTQTDYGRERVRRLTLSQLASSVNGVVEIGRISGNLLEGVTLTDLSIADTEGRPLLVADTVSVDYSLRSLVSKRIHLARVRLVDPVIVLDRPPGGEWNFTRIFASDTLPADTTARGFGSWLRIEGLTVQGGRLVVRDAWSPPDSLRGAARERAIAAALTEENRLHVVATANGYQAIREIRDLDAWLPLLRLADPDSTGIIVEVGSLQGVAYPFRPPAARIRDLSGRFVVSGDSIRLQDVRVELPDSRLSAEGALATRTGNLRARLHAQPIRAGDLRWIDPTLPDSGGGRVDVSIAVNGLRTRVEARDLDLELDGVRLTGYADLTVGDSLTLGPTELVFSGFDTRMTERFAPDVDLPVDGVFDGRLALSGSRGEMDVDAELVFVERGGGRSRVTADGEIEVGGRVGETIRARGLRVRLDPLRVGLIRSFAPNLPVGGTITGTATVNGSPSSMIRIGAAHLVHRDATGTSRLVGRVDVGFEPQRFDADFALQPVSLSTIGRFAPGAGLYGTASGSLRARGTLDDLGVALDLVPNDGGSLRARGTLDLTGNLGYDLDLDLSGLNVARVSTRGPATELTGRVTARGSGTAPATLRAAVSADVTNILPSGERAEAARVRLQVGGGLARVERATLRLASATAEIEGSFGLAAGRQGELRYTVRVDSLSDFDTHLPANTAAADSSAAQPDSVHDPRLAGRVRLEGELTGGIEQFDLHTIAEVEEVLVAGNMIRQGRAELAWLDARTPDARFEVDAVLDSLRTAGLVLDSLTVRVRHRPGGDGSADLAVFGDAGHDLRIRTRYALATERSEIQLDSLRLRLDDTGWALAGPGAVRWGGQGIEVDRIDLRTEDGGRIQAAGRIPTAGTGDFELTIERLQIADFAALLPDTMDVEGLLSFHVRTQGTLENPRLSGDLELVEFGYGGGTIPAFELTFDYADTELAAEAEVVSGGRALLVAGGTLPIDLSLAGDVAERLPERPMRFDIRLDEFQLDSLPPFTTAVSDLRGRIDGRVEVRGTLRQPEVDGSIRLAEGAVDLVQPGIQLRRIAAGVTLREDVVVLDSLVARSDEGPIRATGTIDLTTPARPAFDLTVEASGARVLDNEQGQLVIDSELAIEGPFDGVVVSGDVEILEGVIYLPEPEKQVIDLDDPSTTAVIDTAGIKPVLLPPSNPLFANLQVDVDVSISRNTWVRSSDANIEIYTPTQMPLDLRLDQRERAIAIEGTIRIDRGEYTFSGRRFAVNSGSVVFLGGAELNPLLQLLAEYEVPRPRGKPLTILVTVGGTLAEPTVELESNAEPPLSETDLISFLAFGTSSSSLLSQGGSGLAGDGSGGGGLGALATQKLSAVALGALMDDVIEDLESSGLNELGLDVFRISPADLPEELALDEGANVFRSTELEAGKYLTPEFFVAGKGSPTGALPGVRFEYRTSGGFVWTATWEPRFLPSEPTFDLDKVVEQTRVFGTFVLWEWRY